MDDHPVTSDAETEAPSDSSVGQAILGMLMIGVAVLLLLAVSAIVAGVLSHWMWRLALYGWTHG